MKPWQKEAATFVFLWTLLMGTYLAGHTIGYWTDRTYDLLHYSDGKLFVMEYRLEYEQCFRRAGDGYFCVPSELPSRLP